MSRPVGSRRGRGHPGWLLALWAAITLGGCGTQPAVTAGPPLERLEAEVAAAADTDGRMGALERVVEARARWPHDRRLAALEGELRDDLGDWSGALALALGPVEEGRAGPDEMARARRLALKVEAWDRWLPVARAARDDEVLDRPPAHGMWLQALAATDPEGARAGVRAALAHHPGEPAYLTAAAAIAARRDRWGEALLFADRAITEARRAERAPPAPARTLLALALARREPAAAAAAFVDARAEALPHGRRAEARFLLRHGRPEQAARLLDEWLARHPLDAQSARLQARLRVVVGRLAEAVEEAR